MHIAGRPCLARERVDFSGGISDLSRKPAGKLKVAIVTVVKVAVPRGAGVQLRGSRNWADAIALSRI